MFWRSPITIVPKVYDLELREWLSKDTYRRLSGNHIHLSSLDSHIQSWVFREFDKPPIHKALHHQLGPEIFFPLSHCVLRRVSDPSDHLAFHQDASFMGLAPSITCWAMLRPGPRLELVNKRIKSLLLDHEPGKNYFTRNHDYPEYRGSRWTPPVSPGDVIIFDHFTLHRTEAANGDRISLELRALPIHQLHRFKEPIVKWSQA